MYGIDGELKIPFQETLASLIYDRTFKNIVEIDLHHRLIYIQKLGNKSVHSNIKINRQDTIHRPNSNLVNNLNGFFFICYLPKKALISSSSKA